MTTATCETLTWAHLGDLHITGENEANYRDFLSIVETINTRLAGTASSAGASSRCARHGRSC